MPVSSQETNRYKIDLNGFDTLEALRGSLSYLKPRGVAAVFGSETGFDGRQSFFMWNPDDLSVDNGSTIIKPDTLSSTSRGRWNLLTENPGGAHGVFVQRIGDSMTGFLTLPSDPVNDLHAATKQYVDNTVVTMARPKKQAFLSAASSWPWTHNLGYQPVVEAYNINWEKIVAYIVHNDVNTLTAHHQFNATGYLVAI